MLDNFDNLQASWVTQGGKVGQLSLAFGANDMGSVMIEENVVRAAGAAYCMDELEIVRNIEDAGFRRQAPHMHYDRARHAVFRERDVPRMLELATARETGDTSVPAELANYPARSAAGKRQRSGIAAVPGGVTAGIGMASLLVRAAWVCPMAVPPLADGWVARRAGEITAVGGGHDAPPADRTVDLGAAVVLPGLVNAHTHLELSWLRGRFPPAASFLSWVGQLMRAAHASRDHRRRRGDGGNERRAR